MNIFLIIWNVSKESSLASREYAGVITGAEVIPTSFNECIKMLVKTDKFTLVIKGSITIRIGSKVYINKYNDGRSYMKINGSRKLYLILGR